MQKKFTNSPDLNFMARVYPKSLNNVSAECRMVEPLIRHIKKWIDENTHSASGGSFGTQRDSKKNVLKWLDSKWLPPLKRQVWFFCVSDRFSALEVFLKISLTWFFSESRRSLPKTNESAGLPTAWRFSNNWNNIRYTSTSCATAIFWLNGHRENFSKWIEKI